MGDVAVSPQPGVPGLYDEQKSYFPALPSTDPLNRVWSFAKMIKGAKFIPDSYRDDEKSIAFVALRGHELGLPLTVSLQTFYLTQEGKLGMEGSPMLALLLSKGFKVTFPVHDAERAICRILRPGEDASEAHEEEFTLKEAQNIRIGWDREKQKPKLLTEKFNWQNYPKAMLKWRAMSNCARFKASDVIAGIYLNEELEEIRPDDPTGGAPEPPEGKYTVKPKESAAPEKDNVVDITELAGDRTAPRPAGSAGEYAIPASDALRAAMTTEAAAEKPAPPKPAETKPAETGKVVFEIHYQDTEGKSNLMTSEVPQTAKKTAALRAQALANQTGRIHEVVQNAGGDRKVVETCHPPKPKPAAETPVKPPATDPVPDVSRPATASPLRQRLNDVVALVTAAPEARNTPEKTVQARVNTYLVGYLGVKGPSALPKDEESYIDAMPDLESIARQDVNVLLSEPAEAGKRMAADNAKWVEMWNYTKWPLETCQRCRALARMRGLGPDDLKRVINTAIGAEDWDFEPVENLDAFFRLGLCSREAGKLFRECKKHNLSLAKAVGQIEERGLNGPIEKAETKTLDAAVEGFILSIRDAARAPSRPKEELPPQPLQPEPVEEAAGGGLFDD